MAKPKKRKTNTRRLNAHLDAAEFNLTRYEDKIGHADAAAYLSRAGDSIFRAIRIAEGCDECMLPIRPHETRFRRLERIHGYATTLRYS